MSINKLHRLHFLMCGLVCTQIIFNLSFAQTVTGTMTGTVFDATDNVISGAKVKVLDERTGSVRTATTNEQGDFSLPAMQPGVYTIKIEAQGFRGFERKNIVLSANEHLGLGKLTIEVGQLTDVVTTVAEGATIERESSDLTGRLTSDQIELISTKGRDITSLLRLVPGVSYVDDVESVGEGFGTDLPNVSGQRGRSTMATVNGLNASEPSGNNKVSMTTNQDAIAEVKVLRNNYSPEFGNNGGAQITIVTKSGKKDFFGSAYYFLRNEAFNANSFFNNKQGLEKAKYRHNIWGANVGGPVHIPWLYPNKERKNLFFFYSYEKPHTITPTGARFVTVPTERERNGDFSQSFTGLSGSARTPVKAYIRDPLLPGRCQATPATPEAGVDYQAGCFQDPSRATPDNPTGLNIIPRNRINPSGAAMLNYFPLPNQLGGRTLTGNAFNYVVQNSVDVPKQSQVIRVDFKPTEKNSFYVNAQWWTADNEGFSTSGWPGGDNNTWGISSHYLYRDNGISMNWVRLIGSNMVNEVSVGLRHDSEGFVPSDGEIDRLTRSALNYTAPQLFPANNLLGTIPRATGWGGLNQTTVANINWLDRWGEVGHDYILPSITDNFTLNRGNHTYKAGLYFERMRNGEAPGGNWTGTFNFSSNVAAFTANLGNTGNPYANALTGSFRSYTETSGRPHTDAERVSMQWYLQDQWKVNRSLTLNYGMRMGWYSQWSPREDTASNFEPARFSPAKAQVLYRPFCVGGTPPIGTECATANRRAQNPVTGELLANTNLVGTFVPGIGDKLNGLVLASDPAIPHGFKDPAPIQWEPRFGFAWGLSGSGKTVLRAHGGIYHSARVGGGTNGGPPTGNPPFQRTVTIDFGQIDNLVNLLGTALERPTTLSALERRTHTATIYNFSMGIQQEIGFGTILEVSYVGSLARHLGERRNINAVPDGARFVDLHPENRNPFSVSGALADDFLRPYQGYGDINMVMQSGTSNYNGLQVYVSRRYARSFQYGIAYTWHKTLDYANDDSSDVSYPRPYRAFNYGPADHDQSHIFTANYIWDIPGLGRRWNNSLIKGVFDNWKLSGTTSFVTGRAESVGVDYNGGLEDITGGEVNARPIVLCNPNRRMSNALDGTPVFVDESCFARPMVRGEIGNTSRNMIRRPGVINSDLALFKSIPLRERFKLQFRWETYNIFNHTNFSDIDSALNLTFNPATGQVTQNNPRFGQPTSARSPRVMQASLRLNF
jgi:Carboxypeptidase regulatory-like domain/TonB-dependent Receptor Plug Domain